MQRKARFQAVRSRTAGLADFGQQAFEVVLAQQTAVLHALAVQHIALDGEFAQHLGGSLAERGGLHRVDPVVHRNDGVEVMEIDISGDLPAAFRLSFPEFPISKCQVLASGADILCSPACW